ncbi:MAG: ribonuclease HI [Desulfofustis sp.]|nr:ribonuclease HI [Desulfofustis sp.]
MADTQHTPQLVIYTDGACSPNPGPGGWGAVIIKDGSIHSELSGSEENSTNNRMELTAAVEVLKSVENPAKITLYTDSVYLKNGITDWINKWQRNDWRTADRKEVKNSDLWRQLLEQIEYHQVRFLWIKGHAADPFNIRADELAVAARKGEEAPPGSKRSSSALSTDHIHLFTGVTFKHAARVGGWSVILNWRTHVKILGDGCQGMSANQLYLVSVINGLGSLKKELPVDVHTHSGYLYDGATNWLSGWKNRNWRTREGDEVSNKKLWLQLDGLLSRYEVTFYLEDKKNPYCFLQEAKELAREYEQGFSCR